MKRRLLIWLLEQLFEETLDEDVADILDRLTGYCSPAQRL